MIEEYDDEQEDIDDRVTICSDPECGAQFGPDEEGFGYEECFECGADTYESGGY